MLSLNACKVSSQSKKSPQQEKNIEQRVDSVLALMTLKEKVGQMVQYNGSWDVTGPATGTTNEKKLERLKKGLVGSMLNVVSVKNTREAQRLIMENSRLKIPLIFGYDVIHGYQTMFPVPLGETASWDMDLAEKTAALVAQYSYFFENHVFKY